MPKATVVIPPAHAEKLMQYMLNFSFALAQIQVEIEKSENPPMIEVDSPDYTKEDFWTKAHETRDLIDSFITSIYESNRPRD